MNAARREPSRARGGTARPRAKTKAPGGKFVLRLYVAGATPRSTQAILDARRICEEHLAGAFRLEVIDICQRPTLARDEQIVAVPTLVKRLPLPLKKLVGDLSDLERVLVGLDLRSRRAGA